MNAPSRLRLVSSPRGVIKPEDELHRAGTGKQRWKSVVIINGDYCGDYIYIQYIYIYGEYMGNIMMVIIQYTL